MVNCKQFFDLLGNYDINFFTGVPDSLLKDFCAYTTDNTTKLNHIIAANEGNAIALATGSYLATSQIPLVYMQNSGIGNAINPLASLTDPEVYGIPMLLLIGWRGEPGVHDEPQHKKQGKITTALLDTMEIPYKVLPEDIESAKAVIDDAVKLMKETSRPYALVVKKGTFAKYKLQSKKSSLAILKREIAIGIITDFLHTDKDIVLSTTGKISRELYEYRMRKEQPCQDFLNVGSMGHVSQIALGVALNKPDKQIFCYDGDGAAIMHMGGLGIIGDLAPKNFKHIIFNNGTHDSVGGQPTVGFFLNFQEVAKGAGYQKVYKASSKGELTKILPDFYQTPGPALLEVVVQTGARENLGRPKSTPAQNKQSFMNHLNFGAN
ncbi:MAG: phosphonopyruvate decarboxylase [Bacteriovoracaceae bacterium]|nr:phosphonopyruvate decarboxylase [Bacteriovoracaceae bacterium]